jgi:hypothetical protein
MLVEVAGCSSYELSFGGGPFDYSTVAENGALSALPGHCPEIVSDLPSRLV